MKPGIVASASLHALLLGWGLVSFSAPDPFEVNEPASLPVDLVSLSEFSEAVAGAEDAPQSETPAPTPTEKPQTLPMPAENVGENEADLESPPTPETRPQESRQAAAEAATPPPPEPEPVPQPEPEPRPAPEPVPEPVSQPVPEPTPEPEPVPAETVAEAVPAEPALPDNVPVPTQRPRSPEPVRVAEATPEKPAPEPEKPPEKPKPEPEKPKPAEEKPKPAAEAPKPAAETPKPRREEAKPAETESRGETPSEFNADDIAALIDRQKPSGGGAKRSEAPAAAGAARTTGATLSRGEMDALTDQLGGCWTKPPGTEMSTDLKVVVRFNLDPTGRLTGRPSVESSSGNRAFDESAVRAVEKCNRQGLKVPLDKAEAWANITVDFDPTEMF